MKKACVFLLLVPMLFNYAPASAYQVVTQGLRDYDAIQYTTTGCVEIKDLFHVKEKLRLKATGKGDFTAPGYCQDMTFRVQASRGHGFLVAECGCYACYEKLRYDFGRLGKSQVTLNGCAQKDDRTFTSPLADFGFTAKYASKGNVFCQSGGLDSAQIPSAQGGIKGTVAESDSQVLIGVPVIDVLY